MNPRYERREGEDAYEYGLRLIETKVEQQPTDLDWEDIVEACGLDCHRDSLRKAAAVTPYSGYAVMQYFKKKYDAEGQKDAPSYSKEIDLKIAQLRKEAKRFYDQRREFNSLVDRIGRSENLEDRLVEAAENLAETVGSVGYAEAPALVGADGTEAVLVLNDWHYGMTTDNIWNRYNTAVCIDRVKRVAEAAAERMRLHRVSKLHVIVLGDMIHGAIHVSARVASEELVCDEIMQVSEILAQTVEYLSQYTEETNVYVTYGNHARTVQNKQDSIHRDNLERFIPWWLTWRLKGVGNVTITEESKNEFLFVEAAGRIICAVHGDLDDLRTSPVIINGVAQKQYGRGVDCVLLGDKHHREKDREQLGISAMVCGALCGTDDYANEKRLYSRPEQVMFIVNKEDGIDAEYHLRCE